MYSARARLARAGVKSVKNQKEVAVRPPKIRFNPQKSVSSVFPLLYEGRSRTNQKAFIIA